MWLPMVVHSPPLMTPIFFTERMVKNRSLSALSFQFLFIIGIGLDDRQPLAFKLVAVIAVNTVVEIMLGSQTSQDGNW